MQNVAENIDSLREAATPRVLLIIPCFNEAQNIGSLLDEVKKLSANFDTLVIDDGSSDNTSEVASKRSKTVRLLRNLGIGGAVQTGIRYALEHGHDFCIQVDGDGQHPPDQIDFLLNEHHRRPANLIIGSRFISNHGFSSSWARRIGIKIISTMIKLLFGTKISDPTSGLRLMDRKCIELFSEHYPYDYPEPISNALALEQGLTVREVPVEMRERLMGSSSINGLKPIFYMLRVVGYLILLRLGRHI